MELLHLEKINLIAEQGEKHTQERSSGAQLNYQLSKPNKRLEAVPCCTEFCSCPNQSVEDQGTVALSSVRGCQPVLLIVYSFLY